MTRFAQFQLPGAVALLGLLVWFQRTAEVEGVGRLEAALIGMNRLTPLILLIAVVGLGYLALQQSRKRRRLQTLEVERLFGGVEESRLTSIRLEYIKGSRHVRMERDAGRWFLTDPMAWPVERGVLDKFLGVIARNGADPVSESLAEQVAGSFAPPLGFIETTEEFDDGSTRKVRVEVGQLDIDGMRIFVRRDGRVFRTIRNIENLFDFIVADYRSAALRSPARERRAGRTGRWVGPRRGVPGSRDVGPGAGDHWETPSPSLRWGPGRLHRLDSYLSGMRAKRFASDAPDPDLARFDSTSPG